MSASGLLETFNLENRPHRLMRHSHQISTTNELLHTNLVNHNTTFHSVPTVTAKDNNFSYLCICRTRVLAFVFFI